MRVFFIFGTATVALHFPGISEYFSYQCGPPTTTSQTKHWLCPRSTGLFGVRRLLRRRRSEPPTQLTCDGEQRRRTIPSHRRAESSARAVGVITIVTNELPKCSGNVKNLIKIIWRVMRPAFAGTGSFPWPRPILIWTAVERWESAWWSMVPLLLVQRQARIAILLMRGTSFYRFNLTVKSMSSICFLCAQVCSHFSRQHNSPPPWNFIVFDPRSLARGWNGGANVQPLFHLFNDSVVLCIPCCYLAGAI